MGVQQEADRQAVNQQEDDLQEGVQQEAILRVPKPLEQAYPSIVRVQQRFHLVRLRLMPYRSQSG